MGHPRAPANRCHRLLAGFLAALSALLICPSPALAADVKNVPIVRSESPELPAREQSPWERQKGTILIASLVVAIETALIVALVSNGRRRREIQRRLETRVRFERLLSEFSVSLAATPAGRLDEALDAALARVAVPMRIDWIWRWDGSEPEDAGWPATLLNDGEPAWFGATSSLPPSIQRRLREAGAVTCSTLAVPLIVGEVRCGALFGVSADSEAPWAEQGIELRVVAAVVGTILQRKQAEVALEGSDRLKGAILDSLPAHVAVVDRDGVIIAVNDAWSAFGGSSAPMVNGAVGHGVNYLGVCGEAADAGDRGARDAAILIEQACRGERTARQVEFHSKSNEADRWFLMTAEPLRRAEGGAVVTHWEITRRKLNELALRESEDRFRRMSDALPLAIWMTDVEGACMYLNKQWSQMTGRSLEEDAGDGWLESVHPDDRAACMDLYLRAFHARESFRMEYRIRRYDGTYRWVVDSGTPRYGSDGSFHGFVGGCLDITEQKEAERMLRSLSHRLMVAQDEERRRIARELHDHLSQQLALLSLDLQQLAIKPVSARDAMPVIQEAWRRTTEIASDVHAISHRLHPSKMEALGLVATAQAHCRDVSRQSIPVQFQHADMPSGIQPDRALSMFRVLEEALSNVVRHSGATEAKVTLYGTDTHVVLRIVDNGCGFMETGRPPGGLGLISMRERMQLLEGTLSITSVPAKGCVVEARLPLAFAGSPREAGEPPASPVLRTAPGDKAISA
jgi:PAS domain S-box-containing protein